MFEYYGERKKDLHMHFIDLEKDYDKEPRDVRWWAMTKKGTSCTYIDIVKDMYQEVITNVRTRGGLRRIFLLQLHYSKVMH